MEDGRGSMGAGEVAAKAGVSKDTLRHYERIGVLPEPPRSESGYRRYSAEHVDRVLLIRKALAVGFSLPELSEFLGLRDVGQAPCRKVMRTLQRKRDDLERRLSEMRILKEDLDAILVEWEARLGSSGTMPARLLETLPVPNSSRRKP